MRVQRTLGAVAFILLSAVLAPTDASDKALLAKKLWVAFVCSTYAEMADNRSQSQRLFNIALASGREFIEAARSNRITKEDFSQTVPLGVSLRMQGPTVDFMLGRIFEGAQENAFDKVTVINNLRPKTDLDNQVTDPAMLKSRAASEFSRENCALLN